MIKIRPRRSYLVALESVAMTDIVLNMFIFFFISFSLIYTYNPVRISKIDVRLPRASSVVALEGSEKMALVITGDAKFYIDDTEVERSSLSGVMRSRMKENPGIGVILKIDSEAKFENVSAALDVINGLGIEKVSVAAVKENRRQQ